MATRNWIRVVSITAAFLSVAASATAQVMRDVTGTVLAQSDSTPLSGVRVRAIGFPQRTSSDAEGRFTLASLAARELRLVFERIGVVPDTVTVAASVSTVTVYLRSRPVLLSPVVTEAMPLARERFELLAQTSTMTLDPLDVTNLPGIAEPDVARVVQLLPGTVAKNDFSTGFNVRGGESDQNLIRLDGVTVFNPSHLGGLFSTFDPAAVERVDFITGAFPAGFGGRLSSVLDVALRPGSSSDMRLTGSVSLLASKLLVEGPIANTGATYLFAGRRTYADRLADNFSDDPFTYYFGDALGKVTVPFGTGGIVSLTAYWGRDRLDLPWVDPEPGREGVDYQLWWGNRLVGLTFRQPLGRLTFEQHLSASEFSTGLNLTQSVFRSDNSARALAMQTTLAASLGGGHDVRLGGGYEAFRMLYRTEQEALGQSLLDLAYRPGIWSAFVDDQWRPASSLLVRSGVRVEHVTGRGATNVAPRAGVKLFLSRDFALTGSAGRYYQAVHSIRDQELPITIFDVWIGADEVTPVARSDQLVLGFERWLGPATSITVEGYGKSFNGLATRNPGDDPKVRGDEFVPADGYAWGGDLLLRRHVGSVTGWIAYSFTKTVRRTATDTFPPAHDRRHTVNVVLRAPGPLGSQMGVRWGYGSPLPYTGIVGQWLHREYNPETHEFDGFEEEAIATTINGERYPHYSRLDVSFRWELEKWGATWRPYFQVVNVYNRGNVFVYTFDYSTAPASRSGFTQLPFLPSFGVEFVF